MQLRSRRILRIPPLYLGAVAVAAVAFAVGLMRAPYLIEWNANYSWAIRHLALLILALTFVTARLTFAKWWNQARLRDRLWWPFLVSVFLTHAAAELAPSANAHLGPQASLRVRGTVQRVLKTRRGSSAVITLAGENGTLRLETTHDERQRMRPGMAFDEAYQRGGLGLLYRRRSRGP